MSFFTPTEVYRITIKSPDGAESWVELRPLNAGDQATIQDSIALSSEGEASAKLGTLKRLMVERAVVNWGLDVSPTPNTLADLEPSVFEQIFAEVRTGSPLAETTESEDASS